MIGPRRWATGLRFLLIAAGAAFACWLPFQLSQSQLGLYDRMGLYTLVAIGLTLLMGFAGQMSLDSAPSSSSARTRPRST